MRFQKFDVEKIGLYRYGVMTKCNAELREFMNMNVKCVKCIFGENEYKNSNSVYATYYKAVKRFGFPIKVRIRKEGVYLIRTDM